ncbi:DUF4153 domain-containing protein [Flavobacterium sp. LS1R49]|uniref:DUF4153 domain-containing protein n=1 Tax=Flavobacterium shii TaxID=2987687 RepID=A0A9X2ZIR3_9FLAO|nr:DUF4153 domain-containing protein [Flavobacterium shii]MCV9929417.1 DUF4153 domain-containing protein [Flavobacterium shii]
MAKFPSLQNVLQAALKTISRFPLETITTIFGTIVAIILSEQEYNSQNIYEKMLLCCTLCLVLFLSVSLYFAAAEKKNWVRYSISILLGGIVTAFVFNFSKSITYIETLQFLVLNIALHLLVSFAGFIPKTYHQDEFWEFNKQLFLRILTAGLYSVVLYSGLALAILAVDNLFNVEFYRNIYIHLFFIIAGVFNTIFFLAGVPETNNKEIPLTLSYPKGLKNFTQYVLLPLISLYLAILICYEAKILIKLSLPAGWVSYLVLVFAIFGILSFLLILPIAKETGNLWIRTFNRWFYYLLIPLLGLLFWAILYRVHLYGFTHERYYVLLLAIWLSIIVGYFLIWKQPKIKFIPISMCIAALLSLVGPQSANTVSRNSQLSRFETYIKQIEKEKLTFKQEQDLSSIVDFLKDNYSVTVLVPYTKNKLSNLLKKEKTPSSYQIMEALGVQYQNKYDRKEKNDGSFYYYYYQDQSQSVEDIHGYDMSLLIWNNDKLKCDGCIKIDNITYSINTVEKEYGLDLNINQDIIPLKITNFIDNNPLFYKNGSSKEKIIQKIESPKYSILLTYLSANGNKKEQKLTLNNYQIKVMIKVKN